MGDRLHVKLGSFCKEQSKSPFIEIVVVVGGGTRTEDEEDMTKTIPSSLFPICFLIYFLHEQNQTWKMMCSNMEEHGLLSHSLNQGLLPYSIDRKHFVYCPALYSLESI